MAVAALSVYQHQEVRGPVRAPQTPEETKSHVKGQQACVLPLKLNSLFGGYWIHVITVIVHMVLLVKITIFFPGELMKPLANE